MPSPYSLDLRWRVIWLHLQRVNTQQISSTLCVSERTVLRLVAKFHQTGDVKPLPRGRGPRKLLGDFEQLKILEFIIRHPGIHLHEIQHRLQTVVGVRVHVSTICRILKFMGCLRQVIRHVALQRSEYARAKFMAEVSVYDPSMLIWVDESGSDRRNSTRKYGYSIRGIRPVDHRILIRGVRYTTIPVMSIDGIDDVYITKGTTTGEKFEFFIRNYLLTILQPFNGVNSKSVVIMDNASIHHVDFNVHLIESTGAKLLFLPPYSPDLNPFEPVFGKVKTILKDNDSLFQSTSCPRVFLAMAFSLISQTDCNNFSRHCGYTM